MALVDPNIALSAKPLEIQQRSPLTEAAQVMSLQQAQMQMDKLRKTDEALERIRQVAVKNGGPGDLTEIAQAYMQSPDATHQALGLKIFEQQREKADFNRVAGSLYPELFAPTAAPAAAPANALAPAGAPAAAPANALTPAAAPAAAPVNALAAGGAPGMKTPDQLRREIMLFSSSSDPRAKAMADVLKGQLQEMSKPHVVGGALVTGAGTPIYQAPEKPSELVRNYEYAKAQGYKGSLFDYERDIKQAGRSVTTVAVNTATGKSLAAPVGGRAEASLVKAEGASGIMENANMVREALNSGNVIAGTLAGPRLKFAQLMETVGAGDKQKLVNTRNAIQGLAAMTLESRAELKGQGQVTENEQKLLERARSGNIEDMTVAELQQIVNVSQRLAGRLWSNHETLLKTMESDPAAADALRYYRPTTTLPKALGEGKPQTPEKADERKQGLDAIFGGKR